MSLFGGLDTTNPESINKFIQNIINYALGAIGIVCIIFIIWGGITYITSGGNEERMQKAKSTLTWAIIGFILVLGAGFIVKVFQGIITGK